MKETHRRFKQAMKYNWAKMFLEMDQFQIEKSTSSIRDQLSDEDWMFYSQAMELLNCGMKDSLHDLVKGYLLKIYVDDHWNEDNDPEDDLGGYDDEDDLWI